jgi:hypothetical protein
MTIALIHPSRGRPEKALETRNRWFEKFGLPLTQLRHVISIDSDDPYHNRYMDLFWGDGVRSSVCSGTNKSVVEATNNAATHRDDKAIGDILIYLSDDFDCPENWGPLVLKEFEGVEGPCLIKVDDCLQPFHVPVLTIPIMNRALYERLGYFWHPEYKSMFVDCHLHEVVKKNGWLKLAPHLKFPHNHVSVGKAQDDETYRRSAANWEQGKALFAKHKAMGFPV